MKDVNCLTIIVKDNASMYQSLFLYQNICSQNSFFFYSLKRGCARSWSKYASQLIYEYFVSRNHGLFALRGFSYWSNLQAQLLEVLKPRDISLGRDYLSSQSSNNILFFDKEFMAGCWNISLLMIKVSTILDTSKQDFWIISSELGSPMGPWALCNLLEFNSYQCIVRISEASDWSLFQGWMFFL